MTNKDFRHLNWRKSLHIRPDTGILGNIYQNLHNAFFIKKKLSFEDIFCVRVVNSGCQGALVFVQVGLNDN